MRFVIWSCQHRLPLRRHPAICRVFRDAMGRTREEFRLAKFAWVLMPEHVHLLAQPSVDGRLGPALTSLKLSASMRLLARWKRLDAPILERIPTEEGRPRYWQKGGGFDRNVRDEYEFRRSQGDPGAVYSPQPRGTGLGRAAGGLAVVERAVVDGAARGGVPLLACPGTGRRAGCAEGVGVMGDRGPVRKAPRAEVGGTQRRELPA
ncbi:MAG: transposase [Phycisphaerales bacterium]|nr:transposase [Phycisphaerales bacterium]